MEIVDVHVASIRPAYYNLRQWIADPANVYCGRGRIVDRHTYPPESSPWANPFISGKHGSLPEVLEKYKVYILDKTSRKEVNIESLRGKRGGCWCVNRGINDPLPIVPVCHLDILNQILRETTRDKD